MSNGSACCILEICCGPAGLRRKMVSDLRSRFSWMTEDQAGDVADFVIEKTEFIRTMLRPIVAHFRARRSSQEIGIGTSLLQQIETMVRDHPEPTE